MLLGSLLKKEMDNDTKEKEIQLQLKENSYIESETNQKIKDESIKEEQIRVNL